MWPLLKRLWLDQDFLGGQVRSLSRVGIAFLGYLLQEGIIPTGVDGGGQKYGRLFYIAALFISSQPRK